MGFRYHTVFDVYIRFLVVVALYGCGGEKGSPVASNKGSVSSRDASLASHDGIPEAGDSGCVAGKGGSAVGGKTCIDTGRQTGPGCDMEGVMRAVRRETGSGRGIQACYLKEVGKPAEGRLTMMFSLSPEGRAENMVARDNDFAHTGLAGCVAGVLGRIQYPAPGDVPCQVVYPFTFSAEVKR